MLNSGWNDLNDAAYRVAVTNANSFTLPGADTTDTSIYPVGSGTGAFQKVTSEIEIPQVLTFTTQGGEQQYSTFQFLAESFQRQLPTVFAAQSISMTIAYDPLLPGYQAALVASRARAKRSIRLSLPGGSTLLYNGYISVNPTPTLTQGQVMQSQVSLALTGQPVFYPS